MKSLSKYVFKPYSKSFPNLFLQEKGRILSVVKSALAIEHIGSTAVPDLGGKGIIDIAIAVPKGEMETVSHQLQSLGYEFRPTFSTPDRFYFIQDLPDPEEGTRRYHIHLTTMDHSEWRQFIAFRDYLRDHPEEAKEYAKIKEQAASEAHQDGQKYRKVKEPLIVKIRSFLEESQMGFIEIDRYKFHYRIEGQGPTALVIGNALYYSRSFSKELRESLQMVFVDWRGFAARTDSEMGPLPTFEDLVDDIEKIRQKLGLNKIILIGHSAHALLALEYAKKYPQRVHHLVMIGISPNLNAIHAAMAERNWEESVWPERKAALEASLRQFPEEELAKLPASERFVKWNVRRSAQSWFDYHFDSSPLWAGVSPNMELLDFFYGVALRDLDITKGLDSFHLPVFLALGRFDYIIAPASSWDPVRSKFKHLTVKIFERSGHSPQYEEASLFDQELLKWLKK